uniref:Uncharacterized protein n=1 Tax=Triticum urartu TaxID=4572 RepID=A0A8R7V050_TRIUA
MEDFFLKQGKRLAIFINKEEGLRQGSLERVKKVYHSRGITTPKFFAPAITHNLTSSLMFRTSTAVGVAELRKTLALRFFQISQETSIKREVIADREGALDWAIRSHQSFTEVAVLHSVGMTSWSPSHWTMSHHTLTEKRQWQRRCVEDSPVCIQRGQRPQFGHPRRASLSAVQTLFCITSQAKNLHFGGAQDFQTVTC